MAGVDEGATGGGGIILDRLSNKLVRAFAVSGFAVVVVAGGGGGLLPPFIASRRAFIACSRASCMDMVTAPLASCFCRLRSS